jgi:hypothetical protein
VQTVGQPGEPAPLVGVEDISSLKLDPADDLAGIPNRTCICRSLGSESERKQEYRNWQKVPKVQQSSR